MWRAIDEGGQLQYTSFMDTVEVLQPFYWVRLFGGLLYLSGLLLMAFNFFKTATAPESEALEVPVPDAVPAK